VCYVPAVPLSPSCAPSATHSLIFKSSLAGDAAALHDLLTLFIQPVHANAKVTVVDGEGKGDGNGNGNGNMNSNDRQLSTTHKETDSNDNDVNNTNNNNEYSSNMNGNTPVSGDDNATLTTTTDGSSTTTPLAIPPPKVFSYSPLLLAMISSLCDYDTDGTPPLDCNKSSLSLSSSPSSGTAEAKKRLSIPRSDCMITFKEVVRILERGGSNNVCWSCQHQHRAWFIPSIGAFTIKQSCSRHPSSSDSKRDDTHTTPSVMSLTLAELELAGTTRSSAPRLVTCHRCRDPSCSLCVTNEFLCPTCCKLDYYYCPQIVATDKPQTIPD
jgi:hypothetical protein